MENQSTNLPFPRRLRELMNNNGDCSPLGRQISQAELSQAIGVTRQAISNYMLGVTSPRIEEFQKIAQFFGVSLDYLSGNDDCTIREYEGIHEFTGLSECSIKALHSYKIQRNEIIEKKREMKGSGLVLGQREKEKETARVIWAIDLLINNKDLLKLISDFLLGLENDYVYIPEDECCGDEQGVTHDSTSNPSFCEKASEAKDINDAVNMFRLQRYLNDLQDKLKDENRIEEFYTLLCHDKED